MGGLGKHQFLGADTVLVGYLHQVRDGNVDLALFNLQIFFHVDADDLGHFLGRNVEHVAQTA